MAAGLVSYALGETRRYPGALTELTRWQLEIMGRQETHILVAAGALNINQVERRDLSNVCWSLAAECETLARAQNLMGDQTGNEVSLLLWLSAPI